MRAMEPTGSGTVVRDGVAIGYEVFGEGDTTVVFMPIDLIVHSRVWKAQVPYLARRHRVVTIDPRGNGRSDRPLDPLAYGDLTNVEDTLAVLDEVGVDRAVLVGLCSSAGHAFIAPRHPERVAGVVAFAPGAMTSVTGGHRVQPNATFRDELPTDEGWAKFNEHYWLKDWGGFADFFFRQVCQDPHSSKLIEDLVEYALESTPEVQVAESYAPTYPETAEEGEALLARRGARSWSCTVRGPVSAYARGARVAELTGGAGHARGHVATCPGREPVLANLLIRDFVRQVTPEIQPPTPRRWRRSVDRRRRVLYLSSPIGLGHARRDLAVADALRKARPDVEISWLTQSPVSDFLESARGGGAPGVTLAGQRVAARRVRGGRARPARVPGDPPDGRGARRELHGLPRPRHRGAVRPLGRRRGLGRRPLPARAPAAQARPVRVDDRLRRLGADGRRRRRRGGTHLRLQRRDGRAHRPLPPAAGPLRLRRRPRRRRRPAPGAGLPSIRAWTEEHFDFAGYVMGDRPEPGARRASAAVGLPAGRDGLPGQRRRLRGRRPPAAQGGRGVPEASARIPGLRMVVVAGPRIDPGRSPPAGLDIRGFVPDLDLHHAACDIAVVQGGLTTTMELTAGGRPFLYFPLGHHFEQQVHVHHRLHRYGAGRGMDYREADPSTIADALAPELGAPSDVRTRGPGGAARGGSPAGGAVLTLDPVGRVRQVAEPVA